MFDNVVILIWLLAAGAVAFGLIKRAMMPSKVWRITSQHAHALATRRAASLDQPDAALSWPEERNRFVIDTLLPRLYAFERPWVTRYRARVDRIVDEVMGFAPGMREGNAALIRDTFIRPSAA